MVTLLVPKALNGLFAVAWLFIIFVSVVDGYLLMHTRDVIGDFEQNPVGLTLLAINGGQVWMFLMLKLFGTILAGMLLLVVYQRKPPLGIVISLAIASFQFGLLLFLNYA